MPTLVVVDMQPQFSNSTCKITRAACVREVKYAVKNNHNIVFLEFGGWGKTTSMLTDLTADYPHAVTLLKHQMDGSEEIKQHFEKKNKRPKKFHVCGVNGDQCVYETIRGMKRHFPKSKIIAVLDAINASCSKDSQRHLLSKLVPVVNADAA